MDIKEFLWLVRRLIFLTCCTMFCFAVATFGSGLAPISMLTTSPDSPAALPVNPWQAFIPVLVFSFVIAAIFGYIIVRSRWYGFKLAVFIFITFFGLMTIVGQIESLIFLQNQLPAGMLRKIVLMGLILAGLFSPLAVMIMGKTKQTSIVRTLNPHLVMPAPEWIWRLVVIGVFYVVLYTTFGYFMAWRSPVIQEYYGGYDPGSFSTHLANVWHSYPWMFPFQFMRGLLWMLFALPVIRMHKGVKWEVGLTLALFFAFWSFQLLIPNPVMPANVARVHFIETFSSNFIFGWLVGLLLA